MNSPIRDQLPKLAPPGAGLPKAELRIARLLFAVRRALTSRAAADRVITDECAAIRELVRACAPERALRRVLIARLRGLEDSSRYWSVCMTLDHLRIVNQGIAATMRALLAGRVPPGEASTANVKPSADAGASALPAFEQSCEEILQVARAARSLRTTVRYAHPWFGPIDAAGWHFMAGFHLRLHRKQIELILAGDPSEPFN